MLLAEPRKQLVGEHTPSLGVVLRLTASQTPLSRLYRALLPRLRTSSAANASGRQRWCVSSCSCFFFEQEQALIEHANGSRHACAVRPRLRSRRFPVLPQQHSRLLLLALSQRRLQCRPLRSMRRHLSDLQRCNLGRILCLSEKGPLAHSFVACWPQTFDASVATCCKRCGSCRDTGCWRKRDGE